MPTMLSPRIRMTITDKLSGFGVGGRYWLPAIHIVDDPSGDIRAAIRRHRFYPTHINYEEVNPETALTMTRYGKRPTAGVLRTQDLTDGEKTVECPFCGMQYTGPDALADHIGVSHRSNPAPSNTELSLDRRSSIETANNPYPCEYCGMRFPTTRALGDHYIEAHEGSNEGDDASDVPPEVLGLTKDGEELPDEDPRGGPTGPESVGVPENVREQIANRPEGREVPELDSDASAHGDEKQRQAELADRTRRRQETLTPDPTEVDPTSGGTEAVPGMTTESPDVLPRDQQRVGSGLPDSMQPENSDGSRPAGGGEEASQGPSEGPSDRQRRQEPPPRRPSR